MKNLRTYLMDPVRDFPWLRVEPPEERQRGRDGLLELRKRILQTRKQAEIVPNLDHEYLYHLNQARKAMEEGRYGLACHELKDVIHFREGISRQVLNNILALIESHLEV